VAQEIARTARASACSATGGVQIEAFDAIPYGPTLRDAVRVCLKSDDNELMRHMYQECAKLVKYCGSLRKSDARITLNRQATRLDSRSADRSREDGTRDLQRAPLNSFARCEMTLIEGEVFFQRSEKFARSPAKANRSKPRSSRLSGTAKAYVLSAARSINR